MLLPADVAAGRLSVPSDMAADEVLANAERPFSRKDTPSLIDADGRPLRWVGSATRAAMFRRDLARPDADAAHQVIGRMHQSAQEPGHCDSGLVAACTKAVHDETIGDNDRFAVVATLGYVVNRTNGGFGSRPALMDASAVEARLGDAVAARAAADQRAWERSRQTRLIEMFVLAAAILAGLGTSGHFARRRTRAWTTPPPPA